MKLSEAISKISEITARNGYAFFPSDVGKEMTGRNNCVMVESIKGKQSVLVTINSSGQPLSRIKDHIVDKLDGKVVFADETISESEPSEVNQ